MRRRPSSKLPLLIIMIVIIVLVIMMIRVLPGFGEEDPVEIVEAFYQYEQEGDFGSAWELFHPMMQERFSKNGYVTERSHIYMSHYGVETFSFKLSEAEEVQNWKMAEDEEKIPTAFRIEVQQTFNSKFGTFTVVQEVYVVKVEEVWVIVWEFE
jgi:hypothetical protein